MPITSRLHSVKYNAFRPAHRYAGRNLSIVYSLVISLLGVACLGIIQHAICHSQHNKYPHSQFTFDGLQETLSSCELPTLRDFTFTAYSKSGDQVQVSYVLSGKRVGLESKRAGYYLFAGAKQIVIKDVMVNFYRAGAPAVAVQAQKAVIALPHYKTKIDETVREAVAYPMDFKGAVAVITADYRTLTCDSLHWDASTQIFQANGNCILGAEGRQVCAATIHADKELVNFSVSNERRGKTGALAKVLMF